MNRDEFEMPVDGARLVPVVRWRDGVRSAVDDWLTDEVPVAFEFNGISHAVMLATPADLYGCDVDTSPQGITVHMEVSARSFAGLKERRRTLAGRTGCGVCGTESLDQVLRPAPVIDTRMTIRAAAITTAMRGLHQGQRLNQATGSVHAAAWCDVDGQVLMLREDVGRHNALDKLVGALARAKQATDAGFIAVTSRASVEMVQKAATAGAPLLAAVSAPTTLAVETARNAGMSLVGLVRGADLVMYAHAERVALAGD